MGAQNHEDEMSQHLRLTREQFKAISSKGKRSKYGNKKKEVNGREFDSTKEAKRYQELLMLEKAGEITDLTCQRSVACIVNGMHVCDYLADFVYYCRRRKAMIHEDVKGHKTEVYRLKKKLVLASTGIEVTET